MSEDTYHTPTGGPDSTYVPAALRAGNHVPKVADVPQVSLAKQLLASKSIEQKTLECLERIETLLIDLDRYIVTGNPGFELKDVMTKLEPTETPFIKAKHKGKR